MDDVVDIRMESSYYLPHKTPGGKIIALSQLDTCEYHDDYIITRIIVPREYRRQLYGSALLTKVCEVADKLHRTLYIQPLTYNSQEFSQRALEDWYKKFGFKKFDPSMNMMRRFPKNALASEVMKERGMGWPSSD